MKKHLMAMALAVLFLPAGSSYAAEPEVLEVWLSSDIGKAVVNSGYDVHREQDPDNPLCFTFTNLLKPTRITIQGGWCRPETGDLIQGAPEVDIETPVLKRGEKKRICIEAPKGIKGNIRFEGFYGVLE